MASSDENEAVGSGFANEKQFGMGDPSILSRKPADMVQYMVEEGVSHKSPQTSSNRHMSVLRKGEMRSRTDSK